MGKWLKWLVMVKYATAGKLCTTIVIRPVVKTAHKLRNDFFFAAASRRRDR